MKTAKEILNECFLGVIDFNEHAALAAMEQYAKLCQSLLPDNVSKFIEWLNIEDEWHYSAEKGLWLKYGYSGKTTQQLFDYYQRHR